MLSDTYRTISGVGEGLYKDKGSRFISFAVPVENEDTIKEFLAEKRKEFYDARHHCYAYALGPLRDAWRVNDDGEPSGTAGKPIYGQILSHDLTNILILVIRYFGGTKLGVRGLINAYKLAANEAIEASSLEEKIIEEVYEVVFTYPKINEVMRVVKEYSLTQMDQNFGNETCTLLFAVRKTSADKIKSIFENHYKIEINYKSTR